MSTNLTSGQMIKILQTAQEQGATPESVQRAIGSGIIADALNPDANFDNILAIRKLLGLSPFELRVVTKMAIEVVGGVPYIMVTSNGSTGYEFIRIWEERFLVDNTLKDVILRTTMTPTTDVLYRLPVIRGNDIFVRDCTTTSNIRAEAARRGYQTLSFEATLLLLETVSEKDLERLGLRCIIGMHDPANIPPSLSILLAVDRLRGRSSFAYGGHSEFKWNRECGFVFLAAPDKQNNS